MTNRADELRRLADRVERAEMKELVSGDLFIKPHEPGSIIADALAYEPCAIFAAFSGGDDSLALTHWMMENVPGCQVFHANTGIGVERTREFVRDTCRDNGWPLHEIHAEESGQSYRDHVLRWGFPGPAMHGRMYSRLKERSVRLLVRRHKQHRRDKVLIATGIHKDEARRRKVRARIAAIDAEYEPEHSFKYWFKKGSVWGRYCTGKHDNFGGIVAVHSRKAAERVLAEIPAEDLDLLTMEPEFVPPKLEE